MRTDYVDLCMFHSGTNAELESEGLWSSLQGDAAKSTIRILGVSLSGQSLELLRHQTSRARELGASVIQVLYNRLRPEIEQEVFPLCARDGLGVVARVPLARFLMTWA